MHEERRQDAHLQRNRTARFVMPGLASPSGAALLIRGGQMPGGKITVVEPLKRAGGALDEVSILKFTQGNPYAALVLPLHGWLLDQGATFRYVTDVGFNPITNCKQATRLRWMTGGVEGGVDLGPARRGSRAGVGPAAPHRGGRPSSGTPTWSVHTSPGHGGSPRRHARQAHPPTSRRSAGGTRSAGRSSPAAS